MVVEAPLPSLETVVGLESCESDNDRNRSKLSTVCVGSILFCIGVAIGLGSFRENQRRTI